jgi:hypothetical protein
MIRGLPSQHPTMRSPAELSVLVRQEYKQSPIAFPEPVRKSEQVICIPHSALRSRQLPEWPFFRPITARDGDDSLRQTDSLSAYECFCKWTHNSRRHR